MSIHEEAKVLGGIPPFAPLEPRTLKRLALASERLTYAAGEVLMKQGEVGDCVFVVIDGRIDITIGTGESASHVRELGQYAFVGEIGAIAGKQRTATATAKTDVVALKIPNDVLSQMIDEMPALKERITSHMVKADYVFE